MNSIWLMTSAEYAGDTSLFVRIQNVLLRENGGIFILTSLGLIFLLGLLMSGIIDTREDDVLACLADKFEIIDRKEEKGWVALAAKLK